MGRQEIAEPNDPRVLRALREAEGSLRASEAAETEARAIRLFILGGPVVLQLEVPETNASAALQDQLSGMPPQQREGINPLMTLGYAVQLLFLFPTLALLLTDPMSRGNNLDLP